MLKALFVLSCVVSSFASSHPSVMGRIQGEQVDLKTIQHSFAGSIGDRIIMGHKRQGEFVSEIKILEQDQETVSVFESEEGQNFGGLLNTIHQGVVQSHTVKFIEIVRSENKYVMEFDGQQADVYVTAESFENGHFVNPEYTMDFQGESYHFQLEGQACYGYSLHLISMIMGVLVF